MLRSLVGSEMCIRDRSEDSGYEFLNTPKNIATDDKAEEEPNRDTNEKVKRVQKKKYDMNEQEELELSLIHI